MRAVLLAASVLLLAGCAGAPACRNHTQLYFGAAIGEDGERVDEAGRAFTDANEDRLSEWLNPLQGIARVEIWQTTDQRPGQAQTWLNALVHRHLVER
jgi:hypothetical protein